MCIEVMDTPHLVSPLSISSLKADRRKTVKRHITSRNFSRLNFQLQSPNKGLADKEDKSVKGNSRKKLRRKGKLHKKISSDTGLNELEYSDARVSSTFITDANVLQGTLMSPHPHATTPSVSLNEQKFTRDYAIQSSSSENHLTNYPEFSILNGEIQDGLRLSAFSETSNSILLDSSSLGSSSNQSINADEESTTSDISKSLDYISGNRASSFVSISSDVVGPDSRDGRHLEMWEKREKPVKRLPKSSSAYKVGRFGKENNRSIWQKVQRNDQPTKVNSIYSSPLKKNSTSDFDSFSSSRKLKKKSNPRSRGECEHYNENQMNGYPRTGFQTKKVESLMFKPVHNSQVSLTDSKLPENVCTCVSYLNDGNLGNEDSLLCNSLDQSEPLEDPSAVLVPAVVDVEGDKEVNYSKKWIPVGVKDSPLPRDLSTTKIDESAVDSWSSQTTEKEEISSYSNIIPPEQDNEAVSDLDSKDCNNNYVVAERANGYECENSSSEIVHAVNDACRAQLASEAIQTEIGYPIAEFERLLFSASPVVCLSDDIVSCQSCSRGSSLCEHETPKISIGSLWQWYEKHGTYGLEVKAEDSELGTDSADFRAYFVPYLSAVQLFRKSVEISETYITSGDLEVNESDSVSLKTPQCSLCIKDRDLELVFEFFESEQPQKRRPLFEMIKQLVKGDGPPKCRSDGDPTILDSVDLHDLHPKSWYSVAWYPIYRIPDGNFRAAFLTYHSLGRLVRKCCVFDSLGTNPCIVSPVVGLQSYNAQDECWFRPRLGANKLTAEASNLNTEGILKERLSTLELTASLMARAVVTKGSMTHTNRQPDYEFFVSRQRW